MDSRKAETPDYGIDAPGVVRNLFIAAAAGALLCITAAMGLWSGELNFAPSASVRIHFPIAAMVLWPAAGCALMACWMLWDSKIGKMRTRERLLDQLTWSGSERVLDVGCGRGLMLIGAAKRLSAGMATGIDIWQAEDLSGNTAEATAKNAKLEGVAERVRIETADMRTLPFPQASFDVVVSCSAIHNLYSSADRAKAIREIVRVLRPGGKALIDDIRHRREYAEIFSKSGCNVRETSSRLAALFLGVVTMGSLRPVTLISTKAA